MQITKDTVATISYTVTETNGQVVARTQPGEPVTALIGHGFLVKGLELALQGHSAGDEFAITLTPDFSYGEYDKSLVSTIDRSMFGDFEVAVGNVFEADSEKGPMAVVVKEINDDTVVVDGNHPLAGKVLNFLIVVEDVRAATEEEIKHGHAHVDGHCPSEHHHCCCHSYDEEALDEDSCCCHGHHHDEDEECCHDHHHHEEGKCCHKHHHDDDEKCCHKHHHDADEKCCHHHHHHE